MGIINAFAVSAAIAGIISTLAMLGYIPEAWKKTNTASFVAVKIFFQDDYGKESMKKDKNLNVDVITDISNHRALDENPINIPKNYDNQDDSKDIKVGICGSYHAYPSKTQTVSIHLAENIIDECKKLFPLPK